MNWLLESYSNEIEDLQAGKVRLTKTLEQACKETWESTAFGYGDLSFYTKGQIVGLIFDARLRGVSKGKKSLDDVMRLMMSQYALPKPGYEEDGILKALEQVSGESYAALYKKCVQSVEELPYDEIQQLGLRVVLPEKSYVDPQYQLDEKFFVTQVSPSIRYSGLTEGDKVIEAKLVGEADMKLTVQRVGKTLTILAPGRKYKAVDFRLQINPFATTEQRQRFEEWRARPVPTTK